MSAVKVTIMPWGEMIFVVEKYYSIYCRGNKKITFYVKTPRGTVNQVALFLSMYKNFSNSNF